MHKNIIRKLRIRKRYIVLGFVTYFLIQFVLFFVDFDKPTVHRVGMLTTPGPSTVSGEIEIGESGNGMIYLDLMQGERLSTKTGLRVSYLSCRALYPLETSDSNALTPTPEEESIRSTVDAIIDDFPNPSPDQNDKERLCRDFLRFGYLRFEITDLLSGEILKTYSRPTVTAASHRKDAGFQVMIFWGLKPDSRVRLTVQSLGVDASLGLPEKSYDVRYIQIKPRNTP